MGRVSVAATTSLKPSQAICAEMAEPVQIATDGLNIAREQAGVHNIRVHICSPKVSPSVSGHTDPGPLNAHALDSESAAWELLPVHQWGSAAGRGVGQIIGVRV